MRLVRSVLLGVAAGTATAAALAVVNLLVGPPICVQQTICTPPLPGDSGCGPVPDAACSGAYLSASVIAVAAILFGVIVAGFLALRSRNH